MWHPPINFVTLHYAYMLLLGLLAFPILYPNGNLSAVDTYHFGVSASTVSGLNVVDMKDLQTYQQIYLYFVPIVGNMCFINILVVMVRLFWFRKHLKKIAPALLSAKRRAKKEEDDAETGIRVPDLTLQEDSDRPSSPKQEDEASHQGNETADESAIDDEPSPPLKPTTTPTTAHEEPDENMDLEATKPVQRTITFDPAMEHHPKNDATLYIPGPRDRDRGHPLVELSGTMSGSHEDRDADALSNLRPSLRRRLTNGSRIAESRSIDRVATVASSVFVIGRGGPQPQRRGSITSQQPALNHMPFLSNQATIGRNSQFLNLTQEDREQLGGIEYRSLKLLLKIVIVYFFGLHLLGALCLIPWIKLADAKYKDYLKECAVSETWWAFYSAQTMFNNLGLTLTPDSMVSFRDATWPMLFMSFLAFAGNTFYPVFLRWSIWALTKVLPRKASMQDPLNFLLEHPRRCYTLLFPNRQTWILFGILFFLNFIDTLLIVVLDLHNPAVTVLPVGQRVLAAIYQAASARHTGTATFSLSEVNPAVQLSLLVMMYISVFPLAITMRASNTYEEQSLGVFEPAETEVDEKTSGASYLLKHMQNQLSFDLWYIFLGVFCIAVSESDRIMDNADPAFNMFAILFEVTSAYANVGLSLGYPDVSVSLCGQFTTFGKIVICIMMVRGRHRGLPYEIDRAIMLPDEHLMMDNISVRDRDE